MEATDGPEDVARQMAELDREIVRLDQQIQQEKLAGKDVRKLELQLDRAKRRRGFLEFYAPKAPVLGGAGVAPDGTPAGKSCLRIGCLVLLLCIVIGVGAGALLFVASEPRVDSSGPDEVEVVSEPARPTPAEPVPAPTAPPGPPRFSEIVTRTGRVTAVSGVAPAALGDPCIVTIAPHDTKFNCRIIVRCAGRILYGAENAGYNRCDVQDSAPTSAYDRSATDGDPICELDLPAEKVVIRNDQPAQVFSVTINLAAPSDDAGAEEPFTDAGAAAPSSPATSTAPMGRGTVPVPGWPAVPPKAPSPPPPPKPPATPDRLEDPFE